MILMLLEPGDLTRTHKPETQMCTHTCTCTRAHTRTRTCTHTYIRIQAHTHLVQPVSRIGVDDQPHFIKSAVCRVYNDLGDTAVCLRKHPAHFVLVCVCLRTCVCVCVCARVYVCIRFYLPLQVPFAAQGPSACSSPPDASSAAAQAGWVARARVA